MIVIAVIAVIAVMAQGPQPPSLAEVRDLFEAGKYQETIAATDRYRQAAAEASTNLAADGTWPRVLFLAAQSHQKLGQTEAAVNGFAELAGWPDASPWHFVGYSAKCLIDKQCIVPEAPPGAAPRAERPPDPVQAAQKATTLGATLPEAAYQLGMALSTAGNFAQAAQAFDKAAGLDRDFAYAYYYGGLCHYKARRVDLMASRFEAFLKLAPEAPERPEVVSIMRTLRR